MIKRTAILMAVAFIFAFFSGVAFAGNGPGNGTGKGDKTGGHGPGDCA